MNRHFGLLIYQTLTERGNRTTKNVHRMLLDLDETKITLQNTTNQLMSLQHKQFVENRVYDEDETSTNTSNVPPKEEPPKPKMVAFTFQFQGDGIYAINDFVLFFSRSLMRWAMHWNLV